MPTTQLTRALPSQQVRSLADLITADAETREIELVWSTGSRGLRFGWDGPYYEELSMDPAHVRLDRLNLGANVLDDHQRHLGLSSVLGVVIRAWIEDGKGKAIVKLSDREDVRGVANDILAGIIRNVSIGYTVRTLREVGLENDIPIFRAEDWEPFEVSFTPVPFDEKSQSRSADQVSDCIIISNSKDKLMPTPEETEVRKLDNQKPDVDTKEIEKKAHERALTEERARVAAINEAFAKTGLERALADDLITRGASLAEAKDFIIDNIATRQAKPSVGHQRVQLGELQEQETMARAIEETFLVRTAPQFNKMTELSANYRSATLIDICKDILKMQGVDTRGMSRNGIAERALTRSHHTTSDFAGLLGNTVKKTLADYYQTAPIDYAFMTKAIGVTDYKALERVSISEGPALLEVKEHGEYERGTVVDAAQSMKIKKFGRIFALTRETIVNDDLNAFSDFPRMWAFAAARRNEQLVWSQIVSNPKMADGNLLFSAAHGNLTPVGTELNPTNLALEIAALESTKGFSSPGEDEQYLNIRARYLFVPPHMKFLARQLTTQIDAITYQTVNLFSDIQVISNPLLTGNAWYVAADLASGLDALGRMYMIGEEGPQLSERISFDIDGVEYKCRLDTNAAVLDYRWIRKNPGVA